MQETKRAYKAVSWVKHNEVDYLPHGENPYLFAYPSEVMDLIKVGVIAEAPGVPVPPEPLKVIEQTTTVLVPNPEVISPAPTPPQTPTATPKPSTIEQVAQILNQEISSSVQPTSRKKAEG